MSDPFATLGVEPAFDLDDAQLHQQFLRGVARAHPDRHLDPVDQALAAEATSHLNQAYRVLSDPELRAKALLNLWDSAGEGKDVALPPNLLMEMMEVRETMEQAIAAHDDAALNRLRQWASEARAEHLRQIADAFQTRDVARVRLELHGLRYIERMLEQMPLA